MSNLSISTPDKQRKTPGEKQTTILPAKLTAPKVDGAVARSRLFQLLDEACRRPVVWLGAPAGSGKTTLVASYLAARKIKPLWYQLDLRDADPATFFAFLRQAVGKFATCKCETLPLLTPEYMLSLPVFALNFFEQLFARLPSPAVLVFDNFQDMPESPMLRGLFEQLVTALPDGANLIFISRNDAPEEFARLRAARRMACIGAEEMALSSEEARWIGECMVSDRISDVQINDLNERAGGWVAGFILLIEGYQLIDESQRFEWQQPEAMFDYFANEIFARTQPEFRDFILKTSVFDQFNSAMAEALTNNPESARILVSLVRKNLFTSQIDNSKGFYRYHPLFREFLRLQLADCCSREQLKELKESAAHILISSGQVEDALPLLQASEDWSTLLGLLEDFAPQLIAQGRFTTLLQLLETVPPDLAAQDARVQYFSGCCLIWVAPARAVDCYEKSFSLMQDEGNLTGQLLAWSGILYALFLHWDNFSQMDGWIAWMDAFVESGRQFPDRHIEATVCVHMCSALISHQPQHPQIERWISRSLELTAEQQDMSLRVHALTNAVHHYCWQGDMERLTRYSEQAHGIIGSAEIPPQVRIFWIPTSIGAHWLNGRYAEGIEAMEAGLALARESGIRIWDHMLLSMGTYNLLCIGDQGKAADCLQQLKQQYPNMPVHMRAHYHYLQAWCLLISGRHDLALGNARQAVSLVVDTSAPSPETICRLALALILALNGDVARAREELLLAKAIIEKTKSGIFEFSALMVEGLIDSREPDTPVFRKTLRQLFALGRRKGFYTTYTWHKPTIARLCEMALEENIEVEYARNLIRFHGLEPQQLERAPVNWPWPVKIFTLGRFALVKDDYSVIQSTRIQNKTLDLLKALIALGGRDVSDHKLCQALWPETEGDLAHQNYKVTLHRLRKLIGADALVVQDGKLSLDARHTWVDAWALERHLSALEEATEESEITGLVGEAFKLHNGAFLQADEKTWILTMRERLRDKFLRIIGKVAERLCLQTHCAEVLACYQKGLEIDPLAERFYQGQMQCHYCLKQSAEGLVVYQRCREVLKRELGVAPASKTEELRTKLRQLASRKKPEPMLQL